ncbi:NAD(P)H-binding protein [Streptococcus sp. DD10]|uniref:NAD(P)H-binding protein n=1 Tax=Streptococcus sp. DD10 TaxID=1777878 RepID=UPI00082B32CF|nr:NAD(P)H-binding protein [Streptococcus sp. DD10]
MTTAILLGATGEVGGAILQELLASPAYSTVYVLGRSSINHLPHHPKMITIVTNLEDPQVDPSILKQADVFFAIGTGVRADFERIDYGYAVAFARLCQGKIKSFNLVSANGANPNTSYTYLRVKGQLEEKLRKMDLGQVRFYRPSMLIAPKRANLQLGEAIWIKIFQVISPFLLGPLSSWKGIRPQVVASAMVSNAICANPKTIYRYKDMVK